MKDLYQQVLRYLREMWQRRWAGLAVAWIVAVLGVAVVYRIPERYEATARLYVDTESLLKPLMLGLAIQPNIDQQVALISRTLINRPNIEKLVRMADLDLRATAQAERDELVDSVMRTIRLSGNPSMNLYTLSYRDPDPDQARRVVQSLLTIFVESSLGDKRQDSRAAVRFIDEQIKRYEDTLRAAENRLKDFRLRYIGMSNREGGDFFGRLSTLQGQIDAAQMELRAAEQSREAYKRELSGERATFLPEGPDPRLLEATPEIDARLAFLRKELDELLRRFTDQHPDVTATHGVPLRDMMSVP
jgi:polysaccharide chain length determinant protein (PEP-CTERM system associated)